MRLYIGIALAAVGIVLLIMGINASQSLGSDISRFFTGNPTDRSVWLLIGGAAALAAGIGAGFAPLSKLRRN